MILHKFLFYRDQLHILRVHGSHPKYFHNSVGGNFRLDALQAGIVLVKLPHLDRWHEGRRKNAGFYNARIDGDIGPISKQAIRDFQAANDLTVDGKVGPRTWAVLSKHLKPAEE